MLRHSRTGSAPLPKTVGDPEDVLALMKTAVAIASAADHAIGRNLSAGVTMSVPETLDTASRNQQFGSPQDIRPPRPKRSLAILPPARTLPLERTVSHSLWQFVTWSAASPAAWRRLHGRCHGTSHRYACVSRSPRSICQRPGTGAQEAICR